MTSQKEPVQVYKQNENGKLSVGIRFDNSATLQDLLDAWQPLCDDRSIYKTYAPGNYNLCRGCQINCCNTAYVIPDLIAFKHMADLTGLSYADFIAQYFDVEKLQAGLLRMQSNPCIFLHDNVCTIYPARSLICRFYLCTTLISDTEELIYKIAWSGSAATQIFAEEHGFLAPRGQGATSFDRLLINLMAEYQGQQGVEIFLEAQNYAEIPLNLFR